MFMCDHGHEGKEVHAEYDVAGLLTQLACEPVDKEIVLISVVEMIVGCAYRMPHRFQCIQDVVIQVASHIVE